MGRARGRAARRTGTRRASGDARARRRRSTARPRCSPRSSRFAPGPDTITVPRRPRRQRARAREAFRRALARLDAERLHGTDHDRLGRGAGGRCPRPPPQPSLPESWDAALATLPADWSDLLGEIELDSSDYLEPGALQLAPMNPRRVEQTAAPAVPQREQLRLRRLGRHGPPLPRALRRRRDPRHASRCSGRSRTRTRRHAGPGLADRRPDGRRERVTIASGRVSEAPARAQLGAEALARARRRSRPAGASRPPR